MKRHISILVPNVEDMQTYSSPLCHTSTYYRVGMNGVYYLDSKNEEIIITYHNSFLLHFMCARKNGISYYI